MTDQQRQTIEDHRTWGRDWGRVLALFPDMSLPHIPTIPAWREAAIRGLMEGYAEVSS